MRARPLVLAVVLIPSGAMAQQGFSCSYGARGACLGFGETVCSSNGMCVSSDSACFSHYQCNYEGFTCKSNLTECADDYDGLLIRFNSLVDDYNTLLAASREMQAGLQSANEELADTRRNLRRTEGTLYDIRSCIEGLSRLDDPIICLP